MKNANSTSAINHELATRNENGEDYYGPATDEHESASQLQCRNGVLTTTTSISYGNSITHAKQLTKECDLHPVKKFDSTYYSHSQVLTSGSGLGLYGSEVEFNWPEVQCAIRVTEKQMQAANDFERGTAIGEKVVGGIFFGMFAMAGLAALSLFAKKRATNVTNTTNNEDTPTHRGPNYGV